MNYGKLSMSTLAITLLALAPAASLGLDDIHASAQLESDVTHLHAGSDLRFKVVLDDPLPAGAYFQVRLSPVKVDQELPVVSGEPIDKDRKEFLLHARLPDGSIPGDWHIKIVYLFLAGTSWTNNTLSTNQMPFVLEGSNVEVPTKATATIIGK
jgi:hypothetical protein